MSCKRQRWLVVSSMALSLAFACAEAEEQNSGAEDEGGGSTSGGSSNGAAGKLPTAGSTVVAEGGKAGGSGGKGGTGTGGAGTAGSGGKASGGAAGTSSGGKGSAGSSTGGTATAGTSAGGTASTGLSCTVEAAGGAPGGAGAPGAGGAPDAAGAPGVAGAPAAAGGADVGAGGAPPVPAAFFDDFESGSVSNWTTTLGTWALVDDGSRAYEQSVQENKLQIAIANGVCLADQIIDAKVKVVGFKGQSNSYVAALFGRVLSPTTHYLLALGSDGKLILRKRVNSSSTGATAIGTAVALSVTAGTWYDVHFEIIGTTLKGCVGAVCVTGTDSSIASGSVAVGTVNTSARFDDVRVTIP